MNADVGLGGASAIERDRPAPPAASTAEQDATTLLVRDAAMCAG